MGKNYKNPAWLLLYYKKEIGSDGTSYLCDRDGALPDVKESGTVVWHGCPCSGRSDVRIRRDGWMGRFRETRGSHVPAVSGSTGHREEL